MGNVHIDAVEKSNVMEQHYQESNDPWGNRRRQLYQKVMKYGATKLYEYFKSNNPDRSDIYYYDVGVGGGNVLDTVIENKPDDITLHVGGCDISESAIKYLTENYSSFESKFEVIDCEEYDHKSPSNRLSNADIITIIDVMYYWGSKRDYRKSLDEIWDSLKPGAVILVADSIIPYQRRSYYKSKMDCKVLEEYTDYTVPMGQLNQSNKQRYLKVKIYQKVGK